jgi:ComEC/Rec2-related protein
MALKFIILLLCVARYTITHEPRVLFGICLAWVIGEKRFLFSRPKATIVLYACIGAVSIGSVWFYDMRMGSYEYIQNNLNYIGTGIITNLPKQWQLEFEDVYKQHRLVTSDQMLSIGSLIGISGKISQKSHAMSNITWSEFGAFDYQKRLWMKWYQWVIKPTKLWLIDTKPERKQLLLRKILSDRITTLYGKTDQWWLLLGMLIGSKYFLSQDIYDDFIDSGLVHLIAVSGSNVMLLSIVLGYMLFWMPYYIRLSFIGMGIVMYGSLCGWDSSVTRAVIMGVMGLVALFGGRVTNTLRIIWLTALIMLIRNPYYLIYDLGFGLSFCAVIALSITTQYRKSFVGEAYSETKPSVCMNIVLRAVSDYIIPCFGATLGVLPILLLFSWNYNLTSLLGNFVVQLLIPPLMILGLLSLFVSSYVWGGWVLVATKTLLSTVLLASEQIILWGYRITVKDLGKYVVIIWIVFVLYRSYIFTQHKPKKD